MNADAALLEHFAAPEQRPLLFTEFAARMGVRLTPGQHVIARVAFDGVDPVDLPAEQHELARQFFGPIDRVSVLARSVIVAVCGARGGKSYALVALRLLHLGLTVDVSSLAPGEVGSVPIIAPDKERAKQVYRYIRGAIESDPDLRAIQHGRPVEHPHPSISIWRDGHEIEFVVRASRGRGLAGRGASLLGAALDEAAFFEDEDHKVNDVEQFTALRPRIMPGGQLIVSSTPWAQAGLLFDLFVGNHPEPLRAGVEMPPENRGTELALHAPTLALRDTKDIRSMVEAERSRDPENAAREYDAQFMSAGIKQFFDPTALARAIDDSITEEPKKPEPGDVVTAGGDLGFAKNSAALAITHRREHVVTLAELVEKKPEKSEPLKPSTVCKAFAERVSWHGCRWFMADGHYALTMHEHLAPTGVPFVPAPTDVSAPYVRVRTLLAEGRLRLPRNDRLLRQLREVMSRPKQGGGVTIIKSKWRTGEHGDLADAFVLSAYQADGEVIPPPPPKEGSEEWEAAQREQRRHAVAEKASRPWWMGGHRRR